MLPVIFFGGGSLNFTVFLTARRTAVFCAFMAFLSSVQAETLERMIVAALASHPSATVQRALADAAQSGVDGARWQFYPTPSISAEKADASSSDPSYAGASTVTTLRLQQPLWTGGRLTAGLSKAEAGLLVSQSSVEEVRQQLALRVVQSYGDALAAQLKLQAYEKSRQTHLRLLEQVQRRIEQGASAESDQILARGRLAALNADISVARTQKDMALARLSQLLGRKVDGAPLSAVAQTVDPHLPALLDLALAGNPTLQKAQAQARVQESALAEQRAELSPEVYLRAERQYGSYAYRGAAPENRLFIGLSSRFGAGLSSLSAVRGALAQYQAAQAEIEVQSRLVSEQVQADHALAGSYDEHLAALTASLKAAAGVAESYDRQFLAGRKTWQDVMNAARELAQTEAQLSDTQAAQVVVSWRLAIGTRGLAAVLGAAL